MSFVFFVSAGYPLVPKTISELHLVNEDCYESYVKVHSLVTCPY